MFGRVRAMLENGLTETIIREAGPRVILRTMVHARPDPDQADMLDYDLADDRIVGVVSALSNSDGYASVSVMTDDGGVAMTASGLGLRFQLINESWKREAVLSDKDKQIADLKKDIAAYRAHEPIIEVDDATDAEVSAHVVRRVPTALTRKDIDAIIQRLELTHPKVTNFSAPESSVDEDGTQISYIAPNSEDVSTYTDSAYPDWIAKCRTDLERLHVGREQNEKPVTVTFALKNAGTRPASKLRISFEALGEILLLRRASADEDLDRSEDGPAVTRLPKPPAAPQVQRIVKPPPKPQTSRTTDIAELARSTGSRLRVGDLGLTIPGSALGSLAGANSVLGDLHQSGVFGELARSQSAIQEALGFHRQHENLRDQMGLSHLDAIVPHTTHDFSDILVKRPFVPPKHDPEGFYFDDWEPEIAVKSGALTCDLFRHQGTEEFFVVEVVLPHEGDVSGAIFCRVQAENLTKPRFWIRRWRHQCTTRQNFFVVF